MQELELTLQQEIVQHQRELSGLQTVQNERLNSLTQRHQHEVDQLQTKINQLERERTKGDDDENGCSVSAAPLDHNKEEKEGEGEGGGMKMRCAELEEEAKKLRGRIGELERDSVGRELKEQLQQLSAENTKLSEVNRQLESQLRREQVMQIIIYP
jgi:chromosome segregation ATPase